jgi:hypothetical protein
MATGKYVVYFRVSTAKQGRSGLAWRHRKKLYQVS